MKLKVVNIEDIDLGKRIRVDYGDIGELVASFQTEGIIQPLAVRDLGEDKYALLAGGRRLTAAKVAKLSDIPVRIYPSSLTDIESKSIELAENIYRKDLDWKEEVKIKKQIWELQKKIHGEKTTKSPDDPGTSKRKVAEMLGESASVYSEDIMIAQVVDSIPQLAQAKTKSEAKKIFNKLKGDIARKEITTRIEAKKSSSTSDQIRTNIINGYMLNDFFDGIAKVPDKSVDIVEVDPPYGIALDEVKKSSDNTNVTTLDYNEIASTEYEDFMVKVFEECYRVMKSNAWIITWFGPDPWFQKIYDLMREYFKGNALPAIWTKGQGQTNAPNYYMGNAYEMFFYMRKGNAQLNTKGRSNIFDYKPVSPSQKNHPTERPIEMIQEVLSVFGFKGSTVLVPFLGSGNTLLAANNLDMSGFGFELSPQFKDRFIINVHEQMPGKFKSY